MFALTPIATHLSGTFVAFASLDGRVRLWRVSDTGDRALRSRRHRSTAIYRHARCVTFFMDGKHISSDLALRMTRPSSVFRISAVQGLLTLFILLTGFNVPSRASMKVHLPIIGTNLCYSISQSARS
ncbi:hypothetical protein BDR03DRAFT_408955 [Suillus americanus]|nr:hypothetical protein BDR03DRAFT_408955 [Suillus americanus]